jgi:hypothetical protein
VFEKTSFRKEIMYFGNKVIIIWKHKYMGERIQMIQWRWKSHGGRIFFFFCENMEEESIQTISHMEIGLILVDLPETPNIVQPHILCFLNQLLSTYCPANPSVYSLCKKGQECLALAWVEALQHTELFPEYKYEQVTIPKGVYSIVCLGSYIVVFYLN